MMIIFSGLLSLGTVRDVCCSPDGRWIAFGFSTGLASVLDIRGGLLRSQRRAHTGDIFQVQIIYIPCVDVMKWSCFIVVCPVLFVCFIEKISFCVLLTVLFTVTRTFLPQFFYPSLLQKDECMLVPPQVLKISPGNASFLVMMW